MFAWMPSSRRRPRVLWTSVCALALTLPAMAQSTFTNPLLPGGPDPWVVTHKGAYYFMCTTGRNLTIRKTSSLADLAKAEPHVVWTAPAAGPYSRDIWAPELHHLRGKWYIYFAADAGTNMTHRIYALENAADDPTTGTWTFKGKVTDATDKWAIDATVVEVRNRLYMLWSGWEGDVNGRQDIYIAEMSDPWTIKSARVRLSTSDYAWERIGDRDIKPVNGDYPPTNAAEPTHIDVNEGPEALVRDGKLFVTYSANACWTDFYSLGLLEAPVDANLLDAKSWKKSAKPVFISAPANHAYAPGHNGFFRSADGKEDWIIYHANSESGQGCGRNRSPRMQRFSWNADGTPNFGTPVAVGTPLALPSGDVR